VTTAQADSISRECREYILNLAEEWSDPRRTGTAADLIAVDDRFTTLCGVDLLPAATEPIAIQSSAEQCSSNAGVGVIEVVIDAPDVSSNPIRIPFPGSAELLDLGPTLKVTSFGVAYAGTPGTSILIVGGVPILLSNPAFSAGCGTIRSEVCIDRDRNFCTVVETDVYCVMDSSETSWEETSQVFT
jgi:hypothetical protein